MAQKSWSQLAFFGFSNEHTTAPEGLRSAPSLPVRESAARVRRGLRPTGTDRALVDAAVQHPPGRRVHLAVLQAQPGTRFKLASLTAC